MLFSSFSVKFTVTDSYIRRRAHLVLQMTQIRHKRTIRTLIENQLLKKNIKVFFVLFLFVFLFVSMHASARVFMSVTAYLCNVFGVCFVCVCVCVRERERERERVKMRKFFEKLRKFFEKSK